MLNNSKFYYIKNDVDKETGQTTGQSIQMIQINYSFFNISEVYSIIFEESQWKISAFNLDQSHQRLIIIQKSIEDEAHMHSH